MTPKTLALLGVLLVVVCGVIGLATVGKNNVSELPAAATYATTTSWPPTWLSSANLSRASAWQSFSVDPKLNCNSSSFATDPILGNLYIGRKLNGTTCDPNSYWSLVWATMDWKSVTMNYEHSLLDTSLGPVLIGDGHKVISAYDPAFIWWNGVGWVAFECFYDGGVGSCLGPLKNDLTLDLTRTAVVVTGASNATYSYSASVPKLMVYQNKPYLYWSMLQIRNSDNVFLKVTGRGALLGQESSGAKRLLPVVGTSAPQVIATNDTGAVDVAGVGSTSVPPDPTDADLDIFQVHTDGSSIFTTSGRAGGTCVSPAGTTKGCYRITLGRSTNPLSPRGFNQTLIADKYLPLNPQEYTQFVYRPTDGKTILFAPHFTNETTAMPDVIYGQKYSVWGNNLFPNPVLDTAAPQVTLTAPAANATSSRTINVTASATDNVGVLGVQFKLDGQNFGNELYAAPFAISWDSTLVNDGTHTLAAVVRDGAGRRATSTISVLTRNTPKTKSAFVNDLYTCILMRNADTSGYNTYMSAPTTKKLPTFFTDFFGSAEYINKKTTNDMYVKQLYRCVFYREGDASGVSTWTNALSSGKTRLDVLNSFLASSEFQAYVGPRLQSATGWPYN